MERDFCYLFLFDWTNAKFSVKITEENVMNAFGNLSKGTRRQHLVEENKNSPTSCVLCTETYPGSICVADGLEGLVLMYGTKRILFCVISSY